MNTYFKKGFLAIPKLFPLRNRRGLLLTCLLMAWMGNILYAQTEGSFNTRMVKGIVYDENKEISSVVFEQK